MRRLVIPCEDGNIELDVHDEITTKCADLDQLDRDLKRIANEREPLTLDDVDDNEGWDNEELGKYIRSCCN